MGLGCVDYAPFGGTAYLYTNPEVMNGRFPGQWFQLETGLADNWHRHYDPTLGRYIQPDPLIVDEDDAAVARISKATLPPPAAIQGTLPHSPPDGKATPTL